MLKTPEGIPDKDELDIQYSSKFDMEDYTNLAFCYNVPPIGA